MSSDEGRNAAGGWPPRSPQWWCPNPERWHSDNDDAAEHEVSVLAAAFVTALQPDVAVETGTHAGQTARAIGQALARSGHGMLYTVETEQPFHEQASRACQGLPVTLIHGDSQEWIADPGPPGPVGFAWIDGLWENRAPDLEALLPHFSPGAIAGIHDTGPQFPWVQEALAPLVSTGKIRLLDLRTPRGVSFAQILAA